MANRRDYYFKQPVTEVELNEGFDGLEQADRAMITDQALYGIFQGGVVAQHSPVANLTVDASGPMYGYDPLGQRVFFSGPTLNVDVSQDSSAVATTVATPGNEKWIALTAKFTRVLSDPRTDGNGSTVYFDSTESYQLTVVQGAEAAIGSAARPTLDPNGLLLADVNRRNGQTQILNADIDTSRRQDTFVFAGSPLSIRAGTPKAAVQAMLDTLNAHVTGSSGAHPATAISATAEGTWADGTNIASGNVQDHLDGIVSAIGGTSGGAKVGGSTHAGTRFTVAAAGLSAQITSIQSQIDSLMVNGVDTFKTIADLTALRLITGIANAAILVAVNSLFYQWSTTSTSTDDGLFVIKPTAIGGGSPGRWIAARAPNATVAESGTVQVGTDTGSNTAYADIGTSFTLPNLQPGDIIRADLSTVLESSNASFNASVRVVVVDGASTTLIPGMEYQTPNAASQFPIALAGRYTVVTGGTVTVKIQAKVSNAANTFGVHSDGPNYTSLRAMALRP